MVENTLLALTNEGQLSRMFPMLQKVAQCQLCVDNSHLSFFDYKSQMKH